NAFYLRGNAHQLLERHDEALHDLHQAVLRDPSHTAAYCNQRAHVHATAGEYELALADYGIVLQLDPLNVTALSGREQAQYGLQAQASQPADEEADAKPTPQQTGTVQKPAKQRATMLHRAARDAETTTEAAAADTDVGMDLNTSDDFELLPESVPTL